MFSASYLPCTFLAGKCCCYYYNYYCYYCHCYYFQLPQSYSSIAWRVTTPNASVTRYSGGRAKLPNTPKMLNLQHAVATQCTCGHNPTRLVGVFGTTPRWSGKPEAVLGSGRLRAPSDNQSLWTPTAVGPCRHTGIMY